MERVRTLGLTFITLGMIELAWVGFCVFGGAVLLATGFADRDFGKILWALSAAYAVIAVANVPIALIHLWAGRQLRNGTGLISAIAALAACLASMLFALYCAPFALFALVHGIIVLSDAEARASLDPARLPA